MESETKMAPLEDAATVVLLRDTPDGPAALMLERPARRGSFAGAWVFPGGKVDPEDRAGGDELAAARTAGLREVAEETGQVLDGAAVAYLSTWVPMRAIPRRFRTWFFAARAASELVVLNAAEHGNHSWMLPARALELHAAGEMLLVPPTWVTLHNLRAFATVDEALDAAREQESFDYQTYFLPDQPDAEPTTGLPIGGGTVVWAGDEQYPRAAEAGMPGARHRLNMSALPWTFERAEAH